MLDWDDLRFYLAITNYGNLSAAAKELGVAQSTVGRRLASLEASLGVRLLNRTANGYVPTLAGLEVREQAERVEAEAVSLERNLSGRDTRLSGVVRITCTGTVANHIVIPSLPSLRIAYPDIVVELIPDPREVGLLVRSAEISARLGRPDRNDLIMCCPGSIDFGLYASTEYLKEHGEPDFKAGCLGHDLITQFEEVQDTGQTAWLAGLTASAHVVLRTSSSEAALSAAAFGTGLACLPRFRADKEGRLTRLDVPAPIPSAAIWLVVHRDNRGMARIRATLAHITAFVRVWSAETVTGT